MLGGIIVVIITGFLAHTIANHLKTRYTFLNSTWLKQLFYYHLFLSFVYYLYALSNPSDSRNYYRRVVDDFRGGEWFDFYGTSTTFIEFLNYPLVRFFSFSYEASMMLFAFVGYLGFVYLFIFFSENIRFKHTFLGFNLLILFFLLPNIHFWSGSLGKGAVIMLGFGLFFFGLSKLKERLIPCLIGAVIIYHVRPHIMLVILVSCFLGFIFSTKGINITFRIAFVLVAAVAFFYIYKDVLTMVGIDENEFLTQGLNLSSRARELSKATSGIDISNYNLALQLFTFIYRPLFFDAPGALGLIVSIENVFYLLITIKILNFNGIKFLFTANSLIKSALLSFLTVSIALAQVSGNLGIAIRQKSQVMLLFLFVIISFLDERKMEQYKRDLLQKLRRKRLNDILTNTNVK